MISKLSREERLELYLSQDINNPRWLFHGSPRLFDKAIPKQSHDSSGNSVNIANAVFLFPDFLKATPYAFKETIKANSEGCIFEIPSGKADYLMIMENVNIDENIVGYIYVFDYNDKIKKDDKTLQYKSYEELTPIDIVPICYKDYKMYYQIIGQNKHK